MSQQLQADVSQPHGFTSSLWKEITHLQHPGGVFDELGARGLCLLENWTLLRVTKQTDWQWRIAFKRQMWDRGLPMSKENHLPHSTLLIHCLILNSLSYTCDLESDLKRYVVYQ